MVRKNVIIRTLLIAMTFPLFFVVRDTSALTYSTDVGVQFTFNPALQIDLSSADILIPSLSPGTTADSNVIDVIVKTNNITGYTLNATVGNNTTFDTRDLVHEVSGSSANFASINYGASLTSLTTDNTWGYSYSTDGGTNWEAYDGLPLYSDATNIATLKDASVPPATNAGDIVNFKIAAKASASQASGDYNNVINFIATANPVPTLGPVSCESGKICYNANVLDSTEVEGTMGKQEYANGMGDGATITGGSTATLLASNFSRDGYGFAGWSDTYDYTGNLYGPQEEITTPADMSSGLPLYAIWIQSAGSMQTSDAVSACNSLTAATPGFKSLASVTALTDERDGDTYAVAKLADENCWMIENLRLEDEDTRTPEKQALAQGYGTSATYGNFSGLADAESTNFSSFTTANSLYYSGTQSGDATINIGTTNYPGYRMPRYNNWNNQSTSANRPQNPTSNSATNATTNAGMYSYGNYYTWHAAIADLTYNGTDNQSTTGTSLCPTGWHLPTGGLAYASGSTSGVNVTGDTSTFREFYNLGYKTMDEVKTAYEDMRNSGYAYYSSNTTNTAGKTAVVAIRSFPNNFLYSGYFSTSSAYGRGIDGYYWSPTARSYVGSYSLRLTSSGVYPGTTSSYKYYGYSIRCIVSSGA